MSAYPEYERLLAAVQTPQGATYDNILALRREAGRILAHEWLENPPAPRPINDGEAQAQALRDCFQLWDDVQAFLTQLHETGVPAGDQAAHLEDLRARFEEVRRIPKRAEGEGL